ncbi:MAG TPA: lysophospholipid acyltransferase family protein [Chloroflexota bacterium]|nr:lysophospholipid acyltransferase family protein [Chloroflexota bacterium]HUM69096.1 lysophospholipid acyltransferase family protein [Chloroflexota bacterium]
MTSNSLKQRVIKTGEVGECVPRRGNRVTRALAILFLAAIGWRIGGSLPDLHKFIIVGAPHTSNWDFVLVIATATALGVRISWMGKHSLFRGPLGPVFRWMGGISIDRRATHGIVGENVQAFEQMEKLILCITPEGTRQRVHEWRSGFYQIAMQAGVPMQLAAFDYGQKVVDLGPMIEPTGDYEADLARIKAHYAPIRPRYPQQTWQK